MVRTWIAGFAVACAPLTALCEAPAPPEPETWAVHGQVTNVTQGHPPFRSPYEGDNSLAARGRTEETTDLTVYAGLAPWRGGEIWINPEIDQGHGLSDTLGMAGFPSGEAYKVGANKPYARLPRLFLRQTIALGGDAQPVEAAANQLAGSHTADNLTITVGKFGVVDVFDTNTYAHDPRMDFLNWSIIDSGSFDYAADAWGFTYGAAAEWTQGSCTARAGIFQMSRLPNGKIIKPDFSKFSAVAELEVRYALGERGGKVKLLGFVNHAPMARYRDAVALAQATGSTPDVALVRRGANRPGAAVNVEQELRDDVGAFLRASANDGKYEAYEFTEINRSIAAGVSIKGKRWTRDEDTFGIDGVMNTMSRDSRDYFAAGGLGILIGDGALRYGSERIVEVYYSARVVRGVTVSVDYQRAENPAYNRDRGPVDLFAVRVHAEF